MGYISDGIVRRPSTRPGLAAAIVTSSSSDGKWAPLLKYDVPLAAGQVAELPAAPKWRRGLAARAIERLSSSRSPEERRNI